MAERSWSLKELAEHVGGEVVGDPSLPIQGVARWDEGGPQDLGVVYSPSQLEAAEASAIGALLMPRTLTPRLKPAIRVERPRLAWALILGLFAPVEEREPGVHPTAILGEGVELGEGVSIGPYVVIGARSRIGEGTHIEAHCVLGREVKVGRHCHLYPRVTLYDRVELGDRVILHSGVVLGADGFGYEPTEEGFLKIPQIGRVVVESDVEIGANTTVDRATVGLTRIGRGTKVDNLVQIGHNVRIGQRCLIVAQVGIGGSTDIEDEVALAGQVGIADHLRIGQGAQIAAQSGVMSHIPPRTQWFGYPARPRMETLRLLALQKRLPEMLEQLRSLEQRCAALEAALQRKEEGSS